MREITVPPAHSVPPTENLTDAVWANAEQAPEQVVFSRPVDTTWFDVTARAFADQVRALAKGLIAAGVGRGDRIGLMSRTRYEWTLVDYAIWAAGAVTVPVYETSSPEQVAWMLGDSAACAVVVETPTHAATVAQVRDRLPDLHSAWVLDEGAVESLIAAGADVPDGAVQQRHGAITGADLATIIYTSGTTGRPKGCELSHGNLLAEVYEAGSGFPQLLSDSSTLLFLPLAHVLGRVIQCIAVQFRVRVGHTADTQNLLPDLASFRPTFLLSVPRVFEKVYNGAKQRAHDEGKGAIFDRAERVAVAYSESLDRGGPGLALRMEHAVLDRLVYARLRAALGGRCTAAISGGAPLGNRLAHFFRGIGLTVYEGYGLTETSAAAAVNFEQDPRLGTVGRPVPGTSARIADDGEILLKGDIVFTRYWRNAPATDEALEPGGWFHTGDIGQLDDDGYLTITGRKKEILVTAGGKNVAPGVLEDRLRAHPLISQCMVVGDAQPFIAALITIDPEALPGWNAKHGKPAGATAAELTDDTDLRAEIQSAIDDANRAVSRAESIRKFRILGADFTEESGELTPSLKIKRNVVIKQYADEVAAIYA